ncbi:hypothetical protein FOZ60_006077 [Perkinsus olseni]|uniref:Uncharacterized protein n=1 Tax=Perkinsus olseni TaxID=32597 RepID=A0A7J6NPP5_PEROL|nr:hypothetical protein FOZ60_006077 [Perkinsus olseni]
MHAYVPLIPTEIDRIVLALAELSSKKGDEVPEDLLVVIWSYARPLLVAFKRTRREPARNVRRCLRVPDGSGLFLMKAIATVEGESPPLPRWICEIDRLRSSGEMETNLHRRFLLSPLDVACIAPDNTVICAKSSGVYRYSPDWKGEQLLLSGGRSRFFCLTTGTDCVYGLWGPFRIARVDVAGGAEVVCRTRTVPHCFAAYRPIDGDQDCLVVVLDVKVGSRSVVLWGERSGWKEVIELGDCAAASVDVDHRRRLAYVLAYIKESSSWALWVVDLQRGACRGKFPIPHRRSAAPAAWHRVFARPDGGVWITGAGNDTFPRARRQERAASEDGWSCGKAATGKCDDLGMERYYDRGRQICDEFNPPVQKGLMDGGPRSSTVLNSHPNAVGKTAEMIGVIRL